jgi:BRCA1-associated protein
MPDTRTKSGSTNLPEGTLHLFRDTATKPSHREPGSSDRVILAVLAVPSWMTPSDFLAFVAPVAEGMAHLRIIRLAALVVIERVFTRKRDLLGIARLIVQLL